MGMEGKGFEAGGARLVGQSTQVKKRTTQGLTRTESLVTFSGSLRYRPRAA